jgi:hypothetical protein
MNIEYVIGFVFGLGIMFGVMAFVAYPYLIRIRQHCELEDDKWLKTENRLRKIETAADWWVHHNGCMYDNSSYPLTVIPINRDKTYSFSSAWELLQANREAIVNNMYQAHLRALQDFDQQKQEQTKKKRKRK